MDSRKNSSQPDTSMHPLWLVLRTWGLPLATFGLGVLLALSTTNIASQNDQKPYQRQMHAEAFASQNIPLPSLPGGCMYTKTGDGLSVQCTNDALAGELSSKLHVTLPPMPSIAVPLPRLPSWCQYESSSTGLQVHCPVPTWGQISMPPFPSGMARFPSLPPGCEKTISDNGGVRVTCSNLVKTEIENHTSPSGTVVAMPSLPPGCAYTNATPGHIAVRCEQRTEVHTPVISQGTDEPTEGEAMASPAVAHHTVPLPTPEVHTPNTSGGLFHQILTPFINFWSSILGKK